jgi:hypothetical protein
MTDGLPQAKPVVQPAVAAVAVTADGNVGGKAIPLVAENRQVVFTDVPTGEHSVRYGRPMRFQPCQYQTTGVEISIVVPCDANSLGVAFDRAKAFVEAKLREEAPRALALHRQLVREMGLG